MNTCLRICAFYFCAVNDIICVHFVRNISDHRVRIEIEM